MEKTILLIEDDRGLRTGIAFAFRQDGYEILEAGSGERGYEIFQQVKPDGILLDLNLPDMDGIGFCAKIREISDIPILMLTARDMETDEILGLSSGADDYMTKPFSVAVLKLRMKKLMKRKQPGAGALPAASGGSGYAGDVLCSGEIRLNPSLVKIWKNEEELECSVTEYKILKFFLENKNQVLTQNQILDAVWDSEGKFVSANTLQVNIGRLRKKIETNPSRPIYLKTIHGIGYLWEDKG
ncbi:response regulator transcription factor [Ruminococcus sp. 5_1_39BFAA]|uniref:response regulator transcription factor n=1 Tax=Ruminococcus sp. 5_1_39BFAA TaxID=457412 RepID=UPI0035644D99